MTKNIIVLIFIFVVFADTVVFAFNGGMGNFGKRQFDKISQGSTAKFCNALKPIMSYCLRLATKYPMPQGPNMFTAEEDDRKESESL